MSIKKLFLFLVIACRLHISAPLAAMEQMPHDLWKPLFACMSLRTQFNFANTCTAIKKFYDEHRNEIPCSEFVINVHNIKYDQTGMHHDSAVVATIVAKTKLVSHYLAVKNCTRDGIFEKIGEALAQNTQLCTLHIHPYPFVLTTFTNTYPSARLPIKNLIIESDPVLPIIPNGIQVGWLSTLFEKMPQLENFECSGAYFYDHQSLGVLNSLEKLFSTLKKLTLDNCTMDESDINDITRILQKNKYIEICVLKKASIPYFGKPRNLNYDEAVALVHAANMPGNPLKLLDLSDNKINKQPFTDTLRNDLTIRY